MMLFLKECRKTVFSLTFILYLFVVAAMYKTQFTDVLDSPVTRPVKGTGNYGTVEREVPEILMPSATEGLVSEYLSGSYGAYPIGFYRNVRLKEEDTQKIADIIEELTGITRQELDGYADYEAGHHEQISDENGNPSIVYEEPEMPEVNLKSDITYERFRELMARADDIIGGGSRYSDKYLIGNFSRIPMTYEEAMAEYEEFMEDDNLAKGYVRLFCDYMGIVLSVMPVFVCASFWQSDRRAKMEQLIYSRKISSLKLIGARYLALVSCMTIPVVLTLIHAMAGVNRLYSDRNVSFAGAAGLGMLWLVPDILIVTGLGAFLSEAFSPLLAIFVQGVWWFTALEGNQLTGSITKWTLIIRHNNLKGHALFMSQYGDFLWNRVSYSILSLILLCLTVLAYDRKRRGNGVMRERKSKKRNGKNEISN